MNRTITNPASPPSVLANNPDPRISLNISEPEVSLFTPVSNMQEPLDSQNTPSKFSGVVGFFKNISLIKWGAVIIILAFLGFNIFSALGNATTGVTDLLKPLAALFGYTVGETTKQTVKMSAKGTKEIVDTTANIVDSGVNTLEKSLTGKSQRNAVDKTRTTTMKALNDAKTRSSTVGTTPEADDAGSTTQQSKGTSKSGYCYIGEDRGFRSCIKVNEDDQCLSGKIFPTKDVCINPTLRS